jgi:lysophospholipase L1-like esterase
MHTFCLPCEILSLVGIMFWGLHTPEQGFALRDNDRVVLVGSALIEREQQYGHVELMLHRLYPDKSFIVRNVGWSGDTVWGDARARFGSQADGYKKLIEQVRAEKPTVLIVGYGTNEAFTGPVGLKRFGEEYRRFLSDVATPETRILFITIPWPSLKKPPANSLNQTAYNAAICDLALERKDKARVVDLSDLYQPFDSRPLTDDGILPNDLGYQQLARKVAEVWGSNIQPSKSSDALRQLILEKNRLYFHRYRPENETYLFGFRKHEQGQNAKEVPEFEPLVEELDRKINEMKRSLQSK